MAEDARKPLLIFGDSMMAEIESFQSGIVSEEGIRMVRLIFRPTQELINKHKLVDEDFTDLKEQTFTVDYPEVYVYPMIYGDPRNEAIMVECDFNGRETRVTQRRTELINTNKQMQREITSLRYMNAKLNYELQKASRNYGEYAKDLIENTFQHINKGMRGRLDETGPDMPVGEG